MQWPIIELSHLVHVGSLQKEQKQPNSHEGSGLSVSTEPAAWERINPHTAGTSYQCVKPNNRFLDHYALTESQQQHIIQWGLREQWVEPVTLYRATWFDDELNSTVYIDFERQEDAFDQVDEPEAVSGINGYTMTPAMQKEVHYTTIEHNPLQLLTTLFAEYVLEIDGVWWDEVVDISQWSAPRGVIFNSRFNEWCFVETPKRTDTLK